MADDGQIQTDTILEEYERICRAYEPADIRGVQAPKLTAIAAHTEVSIPELTKRAVSEIDDDRHRRAAFVLLVDPDVRHNNLMERTRLAAAEFGVGTDAFRRVPKSGGLSNRSKVLLEAAQATTLIATQPESAEPKLGAPSLDHRSSRAPATTAPADDARSHKRGLLIGLSCALLASVLLLVWQLTSTPLQSASDIIQLSGEVDVTLQCQSDHGSNWVANPDTQSSNWICREAGGIKTIPADIQAACDSQYGDESTAQNLSGNNASWRCVTHVPTSPGAECPLAAGSFNPSAANVQSTFAAAFLQRYAEAGGKDSLGCPTQLIHRWGQGFLQELEDEQGNRSALLSITPGTAILLTGNAWGVFDRIKGLSGELVGYPTGEPTLVDGLYIVGLNAGGALVAASPEAPYHWLPPLVLESWKSLGAKDSCVGMPISDPFAMDSSFRQDFEHGTFSLNVVSAELSHTGPNC